MRLREGSGAWPGRGGCGDCGGCDDGSGSCSCLASDGVAAGTSGVGESGVGGTGSGAIRADADGAAGQPQCDARAEASERFEALPALLKAGPAKPAAELIAAPQLVGPPNKLRPAAPSLGPPRPAAESSIPAVIPRRERPTCLGSTRGSRGMSADVTVASEREVASVATHAAATFGAPLAIAPLPSGADPAAGSCSSSACPSSSFSSSSIFSVACTTPMPSSVAALPAGAPLCAGISASVASWPRCRKLSTSRAARPPGESPATPLPAASHAFGSFCGGSSAGGSGGAAAAAVAVLGAGSSCGAAATEIAGRAVDALAFFFRFASSPPTQRCAHEEPMGAAAGSCSSHASSVVSSTISIFRRLLDASSVDGSDEVVSPIIAEELW